MIYWLLRSATWLVRWVPSRPRRTIAGLLCVVVYWLWPEKRRHTLDNMAHVLGKPVSDRSVRLVARASWRKYGRYLADFLNFPNVSGQRLLALLVDVSANEDGWPGIAQEELARGKGIIIATAHFGNWDVAGSMVAARMPLAAVVETFKDPRLNALIQGQRAEKHIRVIPMEGAGARQVLTALKKNEAVAIVVDRPLTAKDGVPVIFFGQKTYVPGGPAALALKVGATIIPGFAYYDDRKPALYYGKMCRPIRTDTLPDKSTEDRIQAITQQIYTALEEIITEHPDQWYMFRRFWPEETRP